MYAQLCGLFSIMPIWQWYIELFSTIFNFPVKKKYMCIYCYECRWEKKGRDSLFLTRHNERIKSPDRKRDYRREKLKRITRYGIREEIFHEPNSPRNFFLNNRKLPMITNHNNAHNNLTSFPSSLPVLTDHEKTRKL